MGSLARIWAIAQCWMHSLLWDVKGGSWQCGSVNVNSILRNRPTKRAHLMPDNGKSLAIFEELNRLRDRVQFDGASPGSAARKEELRLAAECITKSRSFLPGSNWKADELKSAEEWLAEAKQHYEKARTSQSSN